MISVNAFIIPNLMFFEDSVESELYNSVILVILLYANSFIFFKLFTFNDSYFISIFLIESKNESDSGFGCS